MYLIAVVAIVAVTLLSLTMFGGIGNVVWLIDLPSFLILLLICIPVLASVHLLKDFSRAFGIVLGRKKEVGFYEIKRSREAVRLAVKTLLLSGIFGVMVSLTMILKSLDGIEYLGPNLLVAMLPGVYAVLLSILLLPLESGLKIREMEFLHKEA